MLDLLLQDPAIERVWCLNRPGKEPLEARQKDAMKSRGLTTEFVDKVAFLEVELSAPHLSLPEWRYSTLRQSITHVIHNAWEINFIKPLEYFEPQIAGIRRLVDFCAECAHDVTLFFTSTVGTGMGWSSTRNDPLPDRMLDWSFDPVLGYSQAKCIAEHILAEASRVSQIRTMICRIGQVAGPTTSKGSWSAREWFPSLLASSAFMRVIPKDLGPGEEISWMPVDLLAGVVLEQCFGSTEDSAHEQQRSLHTAILLPDKTIELPPKCEVFHNSNPNTTTYTALLPAILGMMPSSMEQVTFEEWVLRLQESDLTSKRNPAARLMGMWMNLASLFQDGRTFTRMDTTKTAAKSPKLRAMGPIKPEWMRLWMEQWGFKAQTRAKL